MPTLTKRGPSWQLNWTENGKRHRQSLGPISEHQARNQLKIKEVELQTGKKILGTDLVLRNFADEYLHWYAVEYPDSFFRVEQIVTQHLIPAFGNLPLDEIKKRLADQYSHNRLADEVKRSTVNKELRTLKALINKALDWEYIDYNPLQRLKSLKEFDSKPPRFYEQEELDKIYQFSPYNWHWWRLMANTGLRRKEALQIQPKRDIGREAMRIISTEEARTKSAKWREVPLSESALMAIDRFGNGEKYLFPRVAPASMSRAFTKCVERSGITEPFGSLHCLRHSFCSHLVMNGVSLRVVQALAGHANYATTERYAHLSPGHARDSVTLNL